MFKYWYRNVIIPIDLEILKFMSAVYHVLAVFGEVRYSSDR